MSFRRNPDDFKSHQIIVAYYPRRSGELGLFPDDLRASIA